MTQPFTQAKKYSTGSSNLSITMPTDLLLALNAMAEETGISRNKLIVSAIMTMIEKRRG